ncbi:MAG: hypothetical protein LBM95_04950 [Lactobacillales bacterium]|nr:hypothetical protein [Lactobacillales bacterium]
MSKGKFYDIAFHVFNDRVLVKKEVYSEKDAFDAWEDACVKITDKHVQIFVNEQSITLDRRYIVRVDAREVTGPVEKDFKRRENVQAVVNKLSDMGF